MYSLPKKLQQKQMKKYIKLQSPEDSVKSVKSRICCKKLARALEDALLSIVACAPIEITHLTRKSQHLLHVM